MTIDNNPSLTAPAGEIIGYLPIVDLSTVHGVWATARAAPGIRLQIQQETYTIGMENPYALGTDIVVPSSRYLALPTITVTDPYGISRTHLPYPEVLDFLYLEGMNEQGVRQIIGLPTHAGYCTDFHINATAGTYTHLKIKYSGNSFVAPATYEWDVLDQMIVKPVVPELNFMGYPMANYLRVTLNQNEAFNLTGQLWSDQF